MTLVAPELVGDLEGALDVPFARIESRRAAFVVGPAVGGPDPRRGLPVKKARFDSLAAESKLLPHFGADRELPFIHVARVDLRASGQEEKTRFVGAVTPELQSRSVGFDA